MTWCRRNSGSCEHCVDLCLSEISWRVDSSQPCDVIWRQISWSTLIQVMPWHPTGAMPLHTILTYWKLIPQEQIWVKFIFIKIQAFSFNSSPPGQNGHHFADNVFRCIFVNETFCIMIKIAPNRRQAIIWTNADPVHWRIDLYAALGWDELNSHLKM